MVQSQSSESLVPYPFTCLPLPRDLKLGAEEQGLDFQPTVDEERGKGRKERIWQTICCSLPLGTG